MRPLPIPVSMSGLRPGRDRSRTRREKPCLTSRFGLSAPPASAMLSPHHGKAVQRQEIRVRGEILSYDEATGTGLISGDDSLRYGFARTAVQGEGAMAAGVRVDFVPEGMASTQIMLLPSATAAAAIGQAAGAASSASAESGSGYDIKSAFYSCKGRLRRRDFWISWAILFVVGLVLNFVPKVSFIL